MRRAIIVGLASVAALAVPAAGEAAPPICDHGVLVVDTQCLNPDFSNGYEECDYWISINYQGRCLRQR